MTDQEKATATALLWAGLLHDTGKLGQRADKSFDHSVLSTQIKEKRSTVCPFQGQFHSHLHVLWSQHVLEIKSDERNSTSLVEELEKNVLGYVPENTDDHLTNLAIRHHKPASFLQRIVQMADHWASGMDREKSIDYQQASEPGNFRKAGLVPVFEMLHVPVSDTEKAEGKKQGNFEYNLSTLDLQEKTLMPGASSNELKTDKYNQIWTRFLKKLSQIKVQTPSGFTEELLGVLKEHLWCVPSSTNDYPFVSLYEHSKVVGAMAHCLYRFHLAEPTQLQNQNGNPYLQEGRFPLLLFCADLSGIQKFIYDIGSTKAAKSLKGRSFGLQLLLESVMRELIFRTNTSLAHVVYQSGGKFYMLLPNEPQLIGQLIAFQQELEADMWDQYQDQLYICMGWKAFTFLANKEKPEFKVYIEGQAEPATLGELWTEVSKEAGKNKTRKWQNMAKDRFDQLFAPSGEPKYSKEGEMLVCAVTGVLLDKEIYLNDEPGDEEEEKLLVSPLVKSQVALGKKLNNAVAIGWVNTLAHQSTLDGFEVKVPNCLRIRPWVLNDAEQVQDGLAAVVLLNQIPDLATQKARQTATTFGFYGGNTQPQVADRNEGTRPKTYDELAGQSEEKADQVDYRRLGVLRMDVDNLGSIFKSGFSNPSLAGYAQLSASLDLFFSGYLNTLRETDEFKDHITILYSGGDDVFALGRWDKVIEFSALIRNQFKQFVCQREELGLSAGIVLVGGKFPIGKSAALAGDLESQAKKHESPKGRTKNTLALFDQPMHWFEEWPKVEQEFFPFLKGNLENGYFSSGLVQKLFQFGEMQLAGDIAWHWNASYTIARQIESTQNKKKMEALKDLQKWVFGSDYRLLLVALRWAELKVRMNKKKVEMVEQE